MIIISGVRGRWAALWLCKGVVNVADAFSSGADEMVHVWAAIESRSNLLTCQHYEGICSLCFEAVKLQPTM